MESTNALFDESSSLGVSSSTSDDSWLACVNRLPGYRFLTRVPRFFISENNNLLHLDTAVDDFEGCLKTIMDLETVYLEETIFNSPSYRNVVKLFAMIHERYVNSAHGIIQMAEKYNYREFGVCPRVYCENQRVLPIGLSEQYGENFVKIYCPRCGDIYEPIGRSSNLDGAFFGKTFPQLFFMTMPHLLPLPLTESYTPSLYGFKIAKSAYEPLSEPSICHDKENINPNRMLLEDKNPDCKDVQEQ